MFAQLIKCKIVKRKERLMKSSKFVRQVGSGGTILAVVATEDVRALARRTLCTQAQQYLTRRGAKN